MVAHPLGVLLPSFALALLAITGLARLRVDVTFESFLEDDDPVLIAYESFAAKFGRDERIVISAEPGRSLGEAGVFEARFLERLRALHAALEERVPHLEQVTSLVNARDTRADGDALVVEDFLDPWPEDAADLARLRARAFDNPIFQGTLLSQDGSATALTLELQLYSSGGEDSLADLAGFDDAGRTSADGVEPVLLSGEETAEVVNAVEAVIAEFQAPDFVLHSAGTPIVLQVLGEVMARDMPRFLSLAVVSIGVLLALMFRRLVAALAPLVVVGLTVGATFGLLGWSDTPMHVPTQVLPSLLLAACVGDSVHVLSIFYQRRQAGDAQAEALVRRSAIRVFRSCSRV